MLSHTRPEVPDQAQRGPRWTALLVALFAVGIALRLPTFFHPLLSDDEAIYATTADALRRGDLLYRDVVDHKPPLIYHVYQLGFAALGAYDTQGAHALVVLAVLLTAVFLMAAGKAAGQRAAFATGALFLVFSTCWHDYDALAANCELFVLLPQSLAAWLLLRDFGKSRSGGPALHLAIGSLVGVAALFKYQGLTFLGVSFAMLAWACLLRRRSWRHAAGLLLCQWLGALLPAGLYLAACAHAGSADATLYWFHFNFSYVSAGLSGLEALGRGLRRTLMIGGVALVPYGLGLATAGRVAIALGRALRTALHERSAPRESDPLSPLSVLGLSWLVTSAVAVAAGGRFFGHYFHLVLAPLCLLAGPACVAAWRRGRGARVLLVLLAATPALIFFALASFARPLAMALDESEPPYAAVAARVDALTSAEDRIFVWGNSPQLYVMAQRPMGARFSFCNYMTGESPGTPTETGKWNADANQLPAAWDMLFSDLSSRRPLLFIDAAAAGWDGYDKFPIARYPRLRRYVDEHYWPTAQVNGVVLYRRVR